MPSASLSSHSGAVVRLQECSTWHLLEVKKEILSFWRLQLLEVTALRLLLLRILYQGTLGFDTELVQFGIKQALFTTPRLYTNIIYIYIRPDRQDKSFTVMAVSQLNLRSLTGCVMLLGVS